LIYVSPRPSSAEILRRYSADYFHCERPVWGGYEDYLADEPEIRATFARRLRRLRARLTLPSAARVLDVGCAAGFFMETARDEGFEVVGVEPCGEMAAAARVRGLDVQAAAIEQAELPAESFDLVTLWDVVEHLADPRAALAAVEKWTKPGGYVVLTTPDAGAWLALLLRSRWLGFRSLDEHLYFFNREVMTRMLTAAGLAAVDVRSVGKYLRLDRVITRLRYYTRVGGWLLHRWGQSRSRSVLYLNPLDTMMVVAQRTAGARPPRFLDGRDATCLC
jgi:2-polyprenyl-3-methyl-5-hydroxy-6-metoxy-1,4-benzoquinol methylase